jgi:tetratricopeptide (TPR) repeat protein
VLRGPIRTRDANIYVIDRPMMALELRPQRPASCLVRVQHRVRYYLQHGIQTGRSALIGFLQRNHRLYNLVLKTRERIIARRQSGFGGSDANTVPIPPEALDLYRRAMAARGAGAMRDLFDFYQEQVLRGSAIASAPRDFLDGFGAGVAPRVSEWLKDVVQRCPSFCEAWLELGFLNQEAGNVPDAIDAFRHAAALAPVLPHPLGQPDMRTIANVELAGLLETQGRHAEALAVLDEAPVKRFAPWRFDFLRARLMLREGRIEEALSTFEQCMNWRSASPKLTAGLPMEIGDILEATQNGH